MIEKLQKNFLKSKTRNAAFVLSPQMRRYLTGFMAEDGALFITQNAAYYLLDFRYAEAARRTVKNCEVVLCSDIPSLTEKIIKDEKIETVFSEYRGITYKEAVFYKEMFLSCGTELVLSPALETEIDKMRMVKSASELENITKAQEITDKAFSYILGEIKNGVSEREVAAKLDYEMRVLGSEGTAFDTIVVSGKNGSLCHGVPSDKKIVTGDFITMDFGATVNGYRSDMTRTVGLGTLSGEQKRAYEVVLSAQKAALAAIKAGAVTSNIDKIARDIIDEKYPGAFGHGLGHSVGIDIHESPRFSPTCTTELMPGVIMTVEPGVYLEGKFGLRIEDMVFVTEEGCLNLTSSPKNLIIL